jgi:glutamine amidotransferase
MTDRRIHAAIVDYGLGNLFSVKSACEHVGMNAKISSQVVELFSADLIILPGVGAYGDAMAALRRLDLVEPLRELGKSKKWLIGICLGMQLLMTESSEFGSHKGLDIVEGEVKPFDGLEDTISVDGLTRKLKIPQVGWNQLWKGDKVWEKTALSGQIDGEYMYFVHSFFVVPTQERIVVSTTRYSNIEFCSSLQYNNVFACQFHPERSGVQGLRIYDKIAKMVKSSLEK